MRHSIPGIKAVMILAAATLMTSACQRDPQRTGQGDAATEPRTGVEETTPSADAFRGGEELRRDPASAGAPSGPIDPGLPRDEKGVVGSPHASNLPTTGDRAQQDEQERAPGASEYGRSIQGGLPPAGQTQTSPSQQGQTPQAGAATGDVADHELGSERYSYEDREEFKSFLEARLEGVGRALDAMDQVAIPRDPAAAETQVERQAQRAAEERNLELRQQEVDRLKREHSRITQSLEQIEHVPAQSWEKVRESLTEDVTQLEQDYKNVLQSAREGGES
jgi:Asp-tRNA(Asn)/Glu-tRNA(Gln) amidotransferase C subunit